MNTWIIWTLALIALGIFIYFVPYRNIKIVQNKLDKVIELLEKKNKYLADEMLEQTEKLKNNINVIHKELEQVKEENRKLNFLVENSKAINKERQ